VAAAAGHNDPALAQDGLPVLDEQVAGALARDLTDALMPEVVATFIAEVRERIAAVQQAAAAGDSARAGQQAHALKGSAATFGAAALQARALSIEQAGRAGSLEAVRAQLDGLGACGEAVIALLAARWGGAGRGQRGHGGVPG
jgi:HPt (histidine-containing phosphotransfer) domain-containing protein